MKIVSAEDLFINLLPDEVAICEDNLKYEVYLSTKGLFQIDDYGLTSDFKASLYPHSNWIVTKKIYH